MRIVHVVVTDAFAGTERYVVNVSNELAARGHDVTVIGGAPAHMQRELLGAVRWSPGRNLREAFSSLRKNGRQDVVHAHMTLAEAAAIIARISTGGRLVATRHFAAKRGGSLAGRLLRPFIEHALDVEIAISDFVASAASCKPVTIRNGVPNCDNLYDGDAKAVTVAQRLEREKDTATAITAWARSGLAAQGWRLLIAGDGNERERLEGLVRGRQIHGVEFLGQVSDMRSLWQRTGILLATAPAEPLGLTVLEAMAAGIPVVASDAGGHRETVGAVRGAPLYPPADAEEAARWLSLLAADVDRRVRLGARNWTWQRQNATVKLHVDRLVRAYLEYV